MGIEKGMGRVNKDKRYAVGSLIIFLFSFGLSIYFNNWWYLVGISGITGVVAFLPLFFSLALSGKGTIPMSPVVMSTVQPKKQKKNLDIGVNIILWGVPHLIVAIIALAMIP